MAKNDLKGTKSDDWLVGDDDKNILHGLDGDDLLSGGFGDDDK